MKKIIVTIILLSTLCLSLKAQNVKLFGYVVTEGSRDRIANANITDIYSGKGISSNEYGYYELFFNYGDSVLISVSHIAYEEIMFKQRMNKNIHFDVILKQGHILPEVTITVKTPIEKRLEVSKMSLSGSQSKLIPNIGGEADIMRAFQLMPGVSIGNESNAGINVRGGDLGQNLYNLDGTPLFSINHIGGFLSTFDSDIIEKADLLKGGFPANYGGRLSSVTNVETKNTEDMTRGNLTIGLLNCKFSLAGPLKNRKTSMLFSIRRFMYDLIMYPVSSAFLDDQKIAFTFWDMNFKINHRFNDKNTISFSTYLGDDIYKIGNDVYGKLDNTRFRISGGNKMGSLKWKHYFNEKTENNINLSLTDYHSSSLSKFSDFSNYDSIVSLKNTNTVNILQLRLTEEFCYNLRGKSFLKAGITESMFTSQAYNSKLVGKINDSITGEEIKKASHIYSNEISAYVLGELYFGKYLSTNVGFRITNYYDIEEKKSYWEPEPRILLMAQIPKAFTIKAAYTHLYQNIQSVTGYVIGVSTDRWLMSTGKLQPAKSQQFDIGIARSFVNGMLEISLDAYYKKMDNLAMMARNISVESMTIDISDLGLLKVGGKGKAKGIELLLTKTRGSLTGFLGYSLSQNLRKFEEINNNEYFNATNDRTHTFSVALNWSINDKFSLSANWAFATGAPITVPSGMIYTTENKYEYIYDGVNNYRMRPYHRLDIGLNFVKSLRWGERTLTLSIINVYNRRNPYLYFISNTQMCQLSIIPFMPALSYSVNFNKISLIERKTPYLQSQKEHQEIFRRHSIGFQINEYMGNIKQYKPLVFAARYAFGIKNWLSAGAEFSGFRENKKISQDSRRICLDTRYAFFGRAKYTRLKYLHPFIEIAAYYGHHSQKFTNSDNIYNKSDYFSCYGAPGISINLFKKIISVDFMYKFSPSKIIDNKYYVMSWRLNFNF